MDGPGYDPGLAQRVWLDICALGKNLGFTVGCLVLGDRLSAWGWEATHTGSGMRSSPGTRRP